MDTKSVWQEGMKWMKKGPKAREVDFIAVEKWFGRNCDLKVRPIEQASEKLTQLTPALKVDFIKGKPMTFYRADNGAFYFRGRTFASEQLGKALKKLGEL